MNERPRKNPKTTATPENALTRAEIDERLEATGVGRLATLLPDGSPHLTPVWFLWDADEQILYLTFGADRQHLKNMRRDPRVALVVDRDMRLETGDIEAGAWSICLRGTAELTQDPDLIMRVGMGVMRKAVGEAAVGGMNAQKYVEGAMAEGRWVVRVTPTWWLAWDYNKVK